MGQSLLTGDVSTINIREIVNLGIIGSTNTGKTASSGLLTAYYARKSGYHVIVFDAKNGIDWEPYNDTLEVHPTNQHIFLEQVRPIFELYQSRYQQATAQGKATAYDIGLTPILIIFEEFGALCDGLKSKDKKEYDKVILALSRLLRVSRAGAIHFAFIDQDVSRWDKVIRSLIKYWIGYKLEGAAGHVLGMYKLSGLDNVGQFTSSSNKNDKFQAWHTKEELDFHGLPKLTKTLLPVIDTQMDMDFLNEKEEPERKSFQESIKSSTPVDAENLSEEEVDMIIHYYQSTQSLRQTSQAIWGQGKYGKFYNDILRKVLKENGIQAS